MAADRGINAYNKRPRTAPKRVLDDGCMACNMSQLACDAAWYVSKQTERCCGYCDGHGGLS